MSKPQRNKPLKPPKSAKLSGKSRKAKGEFVFFIGDEGAILCYNEGGEVKRRLFSPAADAKPTETLKELLAEYPAAPISILVDMVEQSYVRHTLPPVSALGVNKIIQRRLSRDFSADDLKGAISLGREKSGRKDWNFLLISLSYKDHLRDWCELVYDLPNRFKGVYLAPVESEGIISMLHRALGDGDAGSAKKKTSFSLPVFGKAKKSDDNGATHWDILVVHNKTGGFRQVVLKNNSLVFTRMAQSAGDEKPVVLAGNIEQEIRNTIEYLKRLSFNETSELTILSIVGQDIKEHLSTESFSAHYSDVFTPHEAAELLGLEQSVLSGDRYTDVLLASAFLKIKKKRLRLLPTYTKKTEACYSQIKAVQLGGGVALLSLCALSFMNLFALINAQTQLSDIAAKEKPLVARVNEFEEKAKTFKVDPFVVDSLIKTHDIISASAPDFRVIVKKLLPLIDENTTLQNFEWSIPDLNANPQSANAPGGNVPVAAGAKVGGSTTQAQTKSVLQMELLPAAADSQSPAEQSEAMIAGLKKIFEGYTVELTGPGAPGSQGGDELTINFEAEKLLSAAALNRKITLGVTITGSEAAAATAAPAPPAKAGQP